MPRYRQKLAFPRLEAGRPFWVDDPNFNLDYHVRHTALPKPGSDEQLRNLVGRIFSQRLDRSKPLWEVWIIHGLEDGRFALISKTHHALVDGVAGVDIATVLFDLSPVPAEPEPDDWTPAPEPSDVDLVAEGVRALVKTPFSLAGRALGAVQHPGETIERVREAAEGLGEVVWAGDEPRAGRAAQRRDRPAPARALGPEPPGRLQGDQERPRRNRQRRRADRRRRGAPQRGCRIAASAPTGLELRALVPVSIRSQDERGALGNRIAAMRGPLPVYVDDPVERLQVVREGMGQLKESKQALGAEVIAGLTDFAPPTLLAQASRLNFSTRLFNLIVTNVPGPQFPLYLLGREMQEIVPIAFLPENHALAVAIMSYNGKVDFGLLADYDAVPDIDAFATHLEESLAELLEASREAAKVTAKSNGRSKDGTPGSARKKTTTS